MGTSIGPVRVTGTGGSTLADVHFDGEHLVLVRYRGFRAVVDRYSEVIIAVAVTLLLGALSFADVRIPLLVAAAVVAVPAAVIGFVPGLAGTPERTQIHEPDIVLMDPVTTGLRPRLHLYLRDSGITLSVWEWRRHQLRRLQRELAR